jgi:hypothetical protein
MSDEEPRERPERTEPGDNHPKPELVGAEPVEPGDPERLSHLSQNRGLIVRRALMATGLGGFIPLPVLDDLIAGRMRAGLYMKLASTRQVDLPQGAADLLSDPREGSAVRNATAVAATLLALKLAWRKVFALLALGRGAEEMATTFQFATLVDHYCARIHVGGPVSRQQAADLHRIIHAAIDATEKTTLSGAFGEGARLLGRSLLEAPRWASERMAERAARWMGSGGNPGEQTAPFVAPPAGTPGLEAGTDAPWLERAARAVEGRLANLGSDYLGSLVDRFELGWQRNSSVESLVDGPGRASG